MQYRGRFLFIGMNGSFLCEEVELYLGQYQSLDSFPGPNSTEPQSQTSDEIATHHVNSIGGPIENSVHSHSAKNITDFDTSR